MTNTNLNNAKKSKNDEFYTQMSDIKAELKHYDKHFEGKKIYCNCDSHDSNFVKYFKHNFERLRLKSFDFTYYDKDTGSGDFRSDESIELLKQSDVIITNPPFSLFKEFISQMMEYNKKFIVLGNMNSMTNVKAIYQSYIDNKIWFGVNKRITEFEIPPQNENTSSYNKDGRTFQKLGNVMWYTNLDSGKLPQDIVLTRKYNKDAYPKYDDYDAINVNKIKDIPCDYMGLMGVPITILQSFNPKQFQIVAKISHGKINGVVKYERLVIKRLIKSVK